MRIMLLIAVAVLAAPDRPDLTPKEAKKPEQQVFGDWAYIGSTENANPVPGQPNYVFRILPTETLWITNGIPSPENGLSAKVTFDFKVNPTGIDFMSKNGNTTLRGIVKVEGDRLALAWTGAPARPTAFSPQFSVHYFRRVTK